MALLEQRRRTIRLLRPAEQLMLPTYMLGAGLAFVVTLALVAHAGLMRPVAYVLADVPAPMSETLGLILHDFAVLGAAAVIAFVLLVVAISVVYMKRMLGPVVAFRRHVEALKNHDYASRVRLRSQDAFLDLAQDLNELAGLLERDEKKGR